MNWYYSNGDSAVGPLGETSMLELHRCGLLTADTPVVREGSDEWIPFRAAFPDDKISSTAPAISRGGLAGSAWTKVSDGLSSAAGLEKLDGKQAKGVFQEIFRKHTAEEMEECFAVGTRKTTPLLQDVAQGWPAPWVFVRLLLSSVLITLAFFWAINRFGSLKLYPGWLFMGAFSIPFSVMIFFLETNTPRNISFYRVLMLFFVGGLLSLVFSLVLYEATGASDWLGAVAAGPVEETGKLLAVVAVARNWPGKRWTLNGMLLGSAVGAGFAAFETAGYILEFALAGVASESGVMILRACCAPFTHVIWTAATAGALWRHMGEKRFSPGMLLEWPVLRIVLMAIILHMIWNSGITVPVLGDLAKILVLGVIGWILVLLLIQDGIVQVKNAVQTREHDRLEVDAS